jgi:hypothetical protein
MKVPSTIKVSEKRYINIKDDENSLSYIISSQFREPTEIFKLSIHQIKKVSIKTERQYWILNFLIGIFFQESASFIFGNPKLVIRTNSKSKEIEIDNIDAKGLKTLKDQIQKLNNYLQQCV